MIDEIDLHLHPKWQMTALPTIAKTLPNIQFIATSHSPLVVGSLEWMNILNITPTKNQATHVKRIEQPIAGLDADQILLTDLFGMSTTRSEKSNTRLKALSLKASEGDTKAALELMELMSKGEG